MAYSKGTGLPMNPYTKTARQTSNRIGSLTAIPSTGSNIEKRVSVNRKPGRNKARVK